MLRIQVVKGISIQVAHTDDAQYCHNILRHRVEKAPKISTRSIFIKQKGIRKKQKKENFFKCAKSNQFTSDYKRTGGLEIKPCKYRM